MTEGKGGNKNFITGSKRVVMVDSYSKMTEFIEPQELKLPSSTTEFEQEGKVAIPPSPQPLSLLVCSS